MLTLKKPSLIEDGKFDHVICLNVLEHVFEFENAFKESVRCIKKGGNIIIATPFMHHIHGSPDDYLRYTESAYRQLAEKHNCTIESITPLGFGLFSLFYQTIGGAIPTNIARQTCKHVSIFLDKTLNKMSKSYKKLSKKIPLGYFVVMYKN